MNTHPDHSRHRVGQKRLLSIDSLRGIAMVLVILAHSYFHVNRRLIPPLLDMSLWSVTNLAAVAFVSISGIMFSYFLHTPSNWRTAYRRFAARAAFLILLAHPAINLTSYSFRTAGSAEVTGVYSFLERCFLQFPITDTIAVCLIVSPVFILHFGPVLRTLTIAAMLATTSLVVAFVSPAEPYLLILKEALFGVLGGEGSMTQWPLLPWLAIFLTGSFLGQALARLNQGTLNLFSFVQKLNKAAIVLAVCCLVLTIGYKILKMAFDRNWSPNLFVAIYPGQTTALLPGYFAVLAWLFVAFLRRIEISGRYGRFLWFLSILGRTSLFTFVVQFAVVESVPALLGLKGALGLAGFMVLFMVVLTAMWLLSYSYGRLRGWFSRNDYAECANTARTHRLPT